MKIRGASEEDWPQIFSFYSATMNAGQTYAIPPNQTLEEARSWWMAAAPAQTVVAVDGEEILGSAKMGPNRPARGQHVATASFLVNPQHRGRGTGRKLGEYVIKWARSEGYHSIQFNAVVESNYAAVHLWQSLGFEIIGTVPEAFEHPQDGYVGLHVMYLKL